MEDILAIILILAIVAGVVFIVNKMVKKHRLEQEEKARLEQKESDRYWAQQANTSYESAYTPQKLSTESESDLAYMLESKLITKRQYNAALREKKKTTPTYSYVQPEAPAPQPTSNLLSDIADIATIVNTVHHWNDHKPHVSNTDSPIDFPREERSVGVTTSESSWGFDDSDSRKSISSSMDTSSSWSSSSSDSSSSWSSSSSSDSSPSSDW